MTTYSGSSLPARQSHVRNHSHTISASTFNSNNRITRRKSVSSTAATNSVAIAAAVKEMNDGTVSAMSVPLSSSRRSTTSRTPSAKSGPLSNYPTPPSSLPSHRSTASSSSRKPERSESAIDDDQNEGDEFEDRANPGFDSTRTRRASEGQYLKGGGKKYHGGELKCDKCGKGYKHSSCLSKHLWEHTPHWSITSAFSISKHQQVQMLEAASVLVQINVDSSPQACSPPSSAKDFLSDQEESSASPAASGYSDLRGSRQSSADTTPPPQTEYRDDLPVNSYQSATSPFQHGMSGSFGFSQSSIGLSPALTAISTGNKEEDEVLANAIGILSWGFANTCVSSMPVDVPPVPALPAQYASHGNQQAFSSSALAPIYRRADSYAASERYHNYDESSQVDVKMEDGEDSVMDEDDYERQSRGRSDEDDEGVFGMEE